jgi:hypothetical protein
MFYEVEKNMVCSTCHVTKKDMSKVDHDADIVSVKTDNWTQVNLGQELDEFPSGYSKSFYNLIKFAKSQGFDNLKFDGDGPIMVGFAKYDW